ncbi:hemerythrin domain-containing protein [Halostreptopolyspora alba]|uniref:Hemerythrin domain-containing protein n=1 Tax=Halostreptopolyspora alba TaxID=2487137 RepID=A0A3N0EIC1_9ACTN|nr:hemerythrin domain-containing protein [Nocardiopsaceae bacterium YIM 96095]
MAEHKDDVITVLSQDHREVEQLFSRLQEDSAPTGEERRQLTDETIIALVQHMVAEEMYVFPATRELVPDGDAIADKELEDHAEVERLMKRIEDLPVTDPRFEAVLEEMITGVRGHVRDEERHLFVALRANATPEELRSLGGKVANAKRIAPKYPRPNAPDTPPLNKLVAPGAGLVDRARDAVGARRR